MVFCSHSHMGFVIKVFLIDLMLLYNRFLSTRDWWCLCFFGFLIYFFDLFKFQYETRWLLILNVKLRTLWTWLTLICLRTAAAKKFRWSKCVIALTWDALCFDIILRLELMVFTSTCVTYVSWVRLLKASVFV